jgi:hypothetical protein
MVMQRDYLEVPGCYLSVQEEHYPGAKVCLIKGVPQKMCHRLISLQRNQRDGA